MQRISFSIGGIRAVLELRAGKERQSVQREHGLSVRALERAEATYCSVPDAVLERIERVLRDRERLRAIISQLVQAAV